MEIKSETKRIKAADSSPPMTSLTSSLGLSQLREQIDQVDDEIIQLICRRIEFSTLIMKQKPPADAIDPDREQVIINRYTRGISDLSSSSKVRRLVRSIIGAARIYPD